MARIGFLFPGQGSQFVGMGKKLCAIYPTARNIFNEADEALGFSLSSICFEGPLETLTLTQNTQPAILTHSIALFRVLEETTGVQPTVVSGHSLGEYSALTAAGALSFRDAVKAVHFRGKWMQEAVPQGQGGMLALVGCEETQAHEFCREVLSKSGLSGVFSVANLNGGGQVVVAGSKTICDWAVAHVNEIEVKPKRVLPLNVSAPFHCALMKPAEVQLGNHLKSLKVSSLKCGYVANVDAELYSDHTGIMTRLIQQVCSPVRWEAAMQRMVRESLADQFWEVGPGRVLTGLMKRIEKDAVIETKGALDE